MSNLLATRLSASFPAPVAPAQSSCLLVRIYPVDGIEKPLELSDESLVIGRDDRSSLQLIDDSVSRRHASIEYEEGLHLVCDLGSTNGTFVNERRLSGRVSLNNGDRVRFGNQIFKYLKSDEIEGQYHELVFKMMTTDGLTSVHNKRYFLETLDREITLATRSGTSLCVMLMDLDHFKSVNDTYGHLAGDAVLVEFARRARSVLRSGELLARYGGEEFAMIMTRSSLADGVAVAERVRRVTEALPVFVDSNSIAVTVSIGVHCFDGQSQATSTELIDAADELMYQAKRLGRNQVQSQPLAQNQMTPEYCGANHSC